MHHSIVAPLTLSKRSWPKNDERGMILHLPKLKQPSTTSMLSNDFSSEEIMARSTTSTEHELAFFKKNFDRQRAALSCFFCYDAHDGRNST